MRSRHSCLAIGLWGLGCLCLAAGPASQPTASQPTNPSTSPPTGQPATKPTTKPAPAPQQTLDAAIRVMPEHARHVGPGKWATSDRVRAANWLKARLQQQSFSVATSRYVWEGGPQRRVNLKAFSLSMWGLRWHCEVYGLLTEEAEKIVLAQGQGQRADKPRLQFHGWATKVETDTKAGDAMTVYVTLENIWIEPPAKTE